MSNNIATLHKIYIVILLFIHTYSGNTHKQLQWLDRLDEIPEPVGEPVLWSAESRWTHRSQWEIYNSLTSGEKSTKYRQSTESTTDTSKILYSSHATRSSQWGIRVAMWHKISIKFQANPYVKLDTCWLTWLVSYKQQIYLAEFISLSFMTLSLLEWMKDLNELSGVNLTRADCTSL